MKRLLRAFAIVVILALALPYSAFAESARDDRVVFGGTYTLNSGDTLDGDLAVFGGAATLETGSRVTGSVFVLGGNIEIRGAIDGDLAVIGGNANLGEQAVVGGDVWTLGGNVNPDGATIKGEFVTGEGVQIPFDFDNFEFSLDEVIEAPFRGFRVSIEARVLTYLFQSFVLAGLAVLVVLLWPSAADRVAGAVVERPAAAGGLGLLTAALSPFVVVVLVITICLIPIALLAILVLVVAGIFGWISLGLEVGRRIARAIDQDFQPILAAGLGTLILALVAFGIGFVSCVGWLAPFLVGCFGLGAVILTRFGTQIYPPLPRDLPEIAELES